jgi:hypothetical protein
MMASGQRYVQWLKSKRCWRFPRRVPGRLRNPIGQTEWIEILPALNRSEADRLAIPHIDETNRIIQLAKRGNWPPISDDEVEVLANGWWEWFGEHHSSAGSIAAAETNRAGRRG